MTDFLLELRSEEIPARMQDKAREDLARLFTAELDKAGLKAAEIITYATPRRLALIAKGLPQETEAVSEETKGPKVGAPPQAMEGFLRKVGLTQEQLVERDGVYFAVVEKPGRKTADVLAEAIPAIIRAFPWPKSQRWGAASISTESLRWVRPLQGIVALLGDDVVPCEIDGIVSGSATKGHRFHHSGEVTIGNAGDYAMKLRAAHVIVDQEERRSIIRAGAEKAAADAGLVLVPDEGLVNENSGLTEWPVPMLGRFDPAFLEVPEEVIQLTARVNQKYFVCHDKAGKLANAFVCTANIVANDGGAAIVAGNEKVLAARLSDAKFFWEQDLKVPLDEQAKKLSQITFHEKLGTVADKVERVAKLARWLVEEGIVAPAEAGAAGGVAQPLQNKPTAAPASAGATKLADMAERAARLCKADLVTGMVGEFPELQGIMGGYYARAQGEADAVADAVRDHYKPVGQGDDVPTAPVTVAVSLADKLDSLLGFFAISEQPTGSRDPFALRRAALGTASLLQANGLRLPLQTFLLAHLSTYVPVLSAEVGATIDRDIAAFAAAKISPDAVDLPALVTQRRSEAMPQSEIDAFVFNAFQIIPFLADRLKVQQREAGVRHDLIDAVFALGGEDDLVRLLARVKALQGFVGTDEGTNLLAGYKRAANILKQAEGVDPNAAATADLGAEERALLTALDSAEPKAAAAIEAEKFEDAMAALASLRAPIDAFFEGVMVNDPDPAKRAFRLGLLARFRDAVHRVADFSRIEG
ncbi:glycine--tRNA ligase subunit beta [Sphingorhabdus sp.]|uniref:glycine--tRNA ligase subunit beta n=1 Tax=Sphingorhabdus sp. TaxID=1902408 RepID=UPI002BCC9F92|nr:glycine--tRNA ligase subunit beta [Sphingorhabdus sp.]HMT42868.1 glycine--tRNA ligase subunit beta [Sphingorhabdus sp.]